MKILDYTLQVLKKNYCSIEFNRYIYEAPKAMACAGGHSLDGNSLLKTRLIALSEKYPDANFQIKLNSDGVPKMKPNQIWKTFKQIPMNKAELLKLKNRKLVF